MADLLGLPDELVTRIASYLHPSAVLDFAVTCSTCFACSKDAIRHLEEYRNGYALVTDRDELAFAKLLRRVFVDETLAWSITCLEVCDPYGTLPENASLLNAPGSEELTALRRKGHEFFHRSTGVSVEGEDEFDDAAMDVAILCLSCPRLNELVLIGDLNTLSDCLIATFLRKHAVKINMHPFEVRIRPDSLREVSVSLQSSRRSEPFEPFEFRRIFQLMELPNLESLYVLGVRSPNPESLHALDVPGPGGFLINDRAQRRMGKALKHLYFAEARCYLKEITGLLSLCTRLHSLTLDHCIWRSETSESLWTHDRCSGFERQHCPPPMPHSWAPFAEDQIRLPKLLSILEAPEGRSLKDIVQYPEWMSPVREPKEVIVNIAHIAMAMPPQGFIEDFRNDSDAFSSSRLCERVFNVINGHLRRTVEVLKLADRNPMFGFNTADLVSALPGFIHKRASSSLKVIDLTSLRTLSKRQSNLLSTQSMALEFGIKVYTPGERVDPQHAIEAPLAVEQYQLRVYPDDGELS